MSKLPHLSFWNLWNIGFGFVGVQIAYGLQSANASRIFSTFGADPHDLSNFWIFPPLAGIIVQPIFGSLSDSTWTRFGRRIPYLFLGTIVAVIVMCILPNAGSLGLSTGAILNFGVITLLVLYTSINIAMQPFEMMVGDMVNDKQKPMAFSLLTFFCNLGDLLGFLFPFILATIGISNIAPQGIVPDSVIYSFYIGAVIMILCVTHTSLKVKEYPPKLHAQYHQIKEERMREKTSIFKLLLKAPKVFWSVGLVQFFCWAAFIFLWTYTNGTIAHNVFNAPEATNFWGNVVLDTKSVQFQNAGDWVGVLFAIQALGSVIWSFIIPQIKNRKLTYVTSLVLGAIGFISINFIENQYALFLSFLLIGCTWAGMLSIPFTILTNALPGSHMGAYLGLFNGTVCIPQIIAALIGGSILDIFSIDGKIAPEGNMLIIGGIFLLIGACCVRIINEKKEEESIGEFNNSPIVKCHKD